MRAADSSSEAAPRLPNLLLGVGLGGFVDGIVLHQILQWHNMLSAVDPPTTLAAMHRNMRADGLFHVATWLSTLAGIVLLWFAWSRGRVPPRGRAFLGDLLLGWGLFNLLEGVIDHHLLGIHHVREVTAHGAYDVLFLLVGGLGLVGPGLWLNRRGRAAAAA